LDEALGDRLDFRLGPARGATRISWPSSSRRQWRLCRATATRRYRRTARAGR